MQTFFHAALGHCRLVDWMAVVHEDALDWRSPPNGFRVVARLASGCNCNSLGHRRTSGTATKADTFLMRNLSGQMRVPIQTATPNLITKVSTIMFKTLVVPGAHRLPVDCGCLSLAYSRRCCCCCRAILFAGRLSRKLRFL